MVIFGDHTCNIKYVDFDFVAGADGIKILRPLQIDEKFFHLLTVTRPIEGRGYGRHYSRLLDNLAPLPPLAEQRRIVERVDQLMALCDQLEERETQASATHQALSKSALHALTTADGPDAFQTAWSRIRDHFDPLFITPESVKALRQTILQLAVMGKLVPQDSNDEPASVLLKKIAAEKARLVKEGKIRKPKPLPSIKPEEVPFDLPVGWEWCRLSELSLLITKGSSPKWQGVQYVEEGEGIFFVTSENVGNFKIILKKKKYVEAKFNEIEPRSILKRNDILMNIVGASIGRTAIYELDESANINQAVCLIRLSKKMNPLLHSFALHFFNNPLCVSLMFSKQVDNARANLSMGNIAKFTIPLPPLPEQARIVAKVDQLMALCDRLEEQLQQSQTDGARLMEATVHHLSAA